MENNQPPIKQETHDRHLKPSYELHEDPCCPREEAFQKADDGDEVPFDVPRD